MKMDDIEIDIETGTEKSFSKIDKLISKLKSLVSTSQMVSNTNKKISESISPTVNKMNDLNKAIESTNKTLSAKPKLSYSDTWKQLQKLKDTYSDLKNTVDVYNSAYPKGTTGEKYLNQPLQKGMSEKGEVVALNMTDAQAKLASYESKIKELEDTLGRLKDQSRQPLNLNTKQAQSDIKNLQKDLDVTNNKLKKTKNRFGLFKGLGLTFTGISTIFSKVGNHFGKTADSMLHKVKKFGLGLLAVRTAMSVLTKAVSAYLSFDGALSDSITNSWNMLGSLLAPAIEMVAQLFATATNYVYTFVKALTGIDFVARANAKALKTQTAATKAAGQAQRSLSSMDEITNLQTDSAGGGGGNIPQITAPEIDSKAMDFIKELIDKIKAGDWYGAGSYIAEKINEALEKADIKKFTDKLKQGILNATDMFNGFIEKLNWSLLGEKFSDLTVGVTGAIRAGIENIHWDSLGKGISNFLNSIDWVSLVDNIVSSITGIIGGIITVFNNIDFSTLMYNISQAVITGINDISKFISEIDWSKLGSQLVDVLLSIDWLGLAVSIVNLAVEGLKALPQLILGIIMEIPKKIMEIDWGKVATDLMNLLLGVIQLDFSSLGVKFGEYLSGMFGNFDEFVANIKNLIGNIGKFASDIMGGFKQLFENIVSGISSTAVQLVGNIVKWITDGINGLFNWINNAAASLWNNVKKIFSNVTSFFGNIINTIKNFVINVASSVGNIIAGAFKAVVNSVLRAIENILNFPIRAINGLINVINKVPGISLGKLNTFNLPRLATGTNEIPQEGIYHLHEGEAVVPKKYNPATGGYDNGADNRQIIGLLVDLNANMLALSEREMAVYMDSRKVAEGIYDDMQTVTKNKNISGVMKRS